jgi:hypothetical protein
MHGAGRVEERLGGVRGGFVFYQQHIRCAQFRHPEYLEPSAHTHQVCDRTREHTHAYSYYQWVPIVLALQGFMFYMPNVLWKLLSWQSGRRAQLIRTGVQMCTGMNLLTIIEKAKAMNNADGATNKDMRNLIRYINASLRKCAAQYSSQAHTVLQALRTHGRWPIRRGVCGSAATGARTLRAFISSPKLSTWPMRLDNST